MTKKQSNNTTPKKRSLLELAMASVPESARFDLGKDEVVKQIISIPLIKVLPPSPTVAKLFEYAPISLMQIKVQSRTKIYLFEPELADDPDLAPFIFRFQIASGRTSSGEMFLSYCRYPNPDNPNRFHTSGIRTMQLALKEPVAKKPHEEGDSAYTVMRFGPDAEVPEIEKPDYDLGELLELAFDGREVLGLKSAVIVELKALHRDD